MIQIIDLYKDYKVGKIQFPALRGINMEINNGEFTAIAGPSGSGKTTLLNIIGCIDVPTSGDVIINGKSTKNLNARQKAELRRRKIGFVFQTFNLIPVLTAFENVEMPLIILRVPENERQERVASMLRLVGLEEYINRKPNEMSGGQQQRVAIARALVKNPDMVLADEPTANLDSNTAKEILFLMKELNKKFNTTFIFSTHDKLVMEFADRIVNLRDGKIIEDIKK